MTPQEIEALRSEALKDKVDALSDMVNILKSERDALAAQVESLRKVANDAIHFASIRKGKVCADPMFVMQQLQNRIDATPQQCLRDVKAEAGRKGFITGACKWVAAVHPIYAEDAKPDIEADADQYAAKVRQGDAE